MQRAQWQQQLTPSQQSARLGKCPGQGASSSCMLDLPKVSLCFCCWEFKEGCWVSLSHQETKRKKNKKQKRFGHLGERVCPPRQRQNTQLHAACWCQREEAGYFKDMCMGCVQQNSDNLELETERIRKQGTS